MEGGINNCDGWVCHGYPISFMEAIRNQGEEMSEEKKAPDWERIQKTLKLVMLGGIAALVLGIVLS